LSLYEALEGQDSLNIQFGKVLPKDFDLSGQKFDTAASAVVIADIGSTSFEANSKGDFTLVFNRFIRVKIQTNNGFDIAEYKIPVFDNGAGDAEKITDLQASTFNLENGIVVETKMDDKSIFNEKLNKYISIKKFTIPGLQPGSVYDVKYTIRSDFYRRLKPWNFQGNYPILWSEYKVTIPRIFDYLERFQGDHQFYIDSVRNVPLAPKMNSNATGNSADILAVLGGSKQERWVKRNVPAVKEEPYIASIQNYLTAVSFRLNSFQMNLSTGKVEILDNWSSACNHLLQREDFGKALDENNHWMSKELKKITRFCNTDAQKLDSIYAFVRDNFSCKDHDEIYVSSSLSDVFKKKRGNVAEINLLLTAMLRHEEIKADPAILSTRNNGFADETFPLLDQFNYVICIAYLGDKMIKLDASQPYNACGKLVEDCYNGEARIINKDKPGLIKLSPDSVTESNLTLVLIVNGEHGFPSGSFNSTCGNAESYQVRESIKKASEKDFFKDLQKSSRTDINIENPRIDSLTQLEFPVSVHYDFDLKNLLTGNMIYFDPLISETDKSNPFISTERKNPVEMPYKLEETYVLNMDIPRGYQIEELPKSARVAYNGNEGIFEYLIQKNTDNIQMRVHLKLNKAFFPTDEYTTLRDFFGYVVKKENEQIVFKKIP
jgi:hypothetical protein